MVVPIHQQCMRGLSSHTCQHLVHTHLHIHIYVWNMNFQLSCFNLILPFKLNQHTSLKFDHSQIYQSFPLGVVPIQALSQKALPWQSLSWYSLFALPNSPPSFSTLVLSKATSIDCQLGSLGLYLPVGFGQWEASLGDHKTGSRESFAIQIPDFLSPCYVKVW